MPTRHCRVGRAYCAYIATKPKPVKISGSLRLKLELKTANPHPLRIMFGNYYILNS